MLAVWFDAFKQLIAQCGDRLAGKVLVDPTNPVGPDGKGGIHTLIGEQESSGQLLAGLLPAGAPLVKAFSTRRPTQVRGRAPGARRAVLFYAADDDAAGEEVADRSASPATNRSLRGRPGRVDPPRGARRTANSPSC